MQAGVPNATQLQRLIHFAKHPKANSAIDTLIPSILTKDREQYVRSQMSPVIDECCKFEETGRDSPTFRRPSEVGGPAL